MDSIFVKSFHPYISCVLLCLLVLSCGMGTYSAPAETPMSIQGLKKFCGLPASCNTPVGWEGRTVVVEGYLDKANVFDKRRYPNLPYEKFKIGDRKGNTLEVWATAADNGPIFNKLDRRRSDKIVVHGRLASVKAPVMGECKLGVKVLIDDPNQIELQTP